MNDRHLNSPYPIRPTPELRGKLEEAARAGGRSLHAEIIQRLEASFGTENQSAAQGTSFAQPIILQRLVEYQRAITALLLTLEEGIEILEDELPPEKRDQHPFHHFLHSADSLVHDVKRELKKYGGTK